VLTVCVTEPITMLAMVTPSTLARSFKARTVRPGKTTDKTFLSSAFLLAGFTSLGAATAATSDLGSVVFGSGSFSTAEAAEEISAGLLAWEVVVLADLVFLGVRDFIPLIASQKVLINADRHDLDFWVYVLTCFTSSTDRRGTQRARRSGREDDAQNLVVQVVSCLPSFAWASLSGSPVARSVMGMGVVASLSTTSGSSPNGVAYATARSSTIPSPSRGS